MDTADHVKWICEICFIAFDSDWVLKQHSIATHVEESSESLLAEKRNSSVEQICETQFEEDSERTFKCKQCPKAFKRASELIAHLRDHTVNFKEALKPTIVSNKEKNNLKETKKSQLTEIKNSSKKLGYGDEKFEDDWIEWNPADFSKCRDKYSRPKECKESRNYEEVYASFLSNGVFPELSAENLGISSQDASQLTKQEVYASFLNNGVFPELSAQNSLLKETQWTKQQLSSNQPKPTLRMTRREKSRKLVTDPSKKSLLLQPGPVPKLIPVIAIPLDEQEHLIGRNGSSVTPSVGKIVTTSIPNPIFLKGTNFFTCPALYCDYKGLTADHDCKASECDKSQKRKVSKRAATYKSRAERTKAKEILEKKVMDTEKEVEKLKLKFDMSSDSTNPFPDTYSKSGTIRYNPKKTYLERKIQNRQSAMLSRERKKAEIENLKQRLKEASNEAEILKELKVAC